MNYTEKYHLPQWVKEDRIMMEDFNAAMAGIEKGLNDSKAVIDQNQSTVENVGAQIWSAVTRCARNILFGTMEQNGKDKIFCANSLLCHPLGTKELAGTLSGGKWSDALGVFAGRGEERTGVDLKKQCISFQGGNLKLPSSSSNSRSHYEFTAPVTGVIRGFTLFTNLSVLPTGGDPHLNRPVQFTAKKKVGDSYSETVYQKDFILDKIFTQAEDYEDEITVEVPITKGSSYYFELKLSGSTDIYGRYGFVVNATPGDSYLEDIHWIDHSQFRIYNQPVPAVTVSRTMPAEGTVNRAAAIVRYQKDGASPTTAVTLNGQAMRWEGDHERTTPEGVPYIEAWFSYQGEPMSGDLTVRVTMTSAGADEGRLLEYGVMLL